MGPGLAILSSLRVGCFGNGGRASSGLGTLAATAVAASAGPDADNAVATVEKRANARIFKDIGLGMGNGATSYNNNTKKKKKENGGISALQILTAEDTPHTVSDW